LKIVVYCTVTSCCSVRRMRKHWKVVGLSDFLSKKSRTYCHKRWFWECRR
jgi:hypothetical protein